MDKNTILMPNSPVVVSETQTLEEVKRHPTSAIHEAYGLQVTHAVRDSIGHPRNRVRPRQFGFYSLCHLLSGNGWVWFEGNRVELIGAGQGVLVFPGMVFDYAGHESKWHEDYVCFTGPTADAWAQSGIIKAGVCNLGTDRVLPGIIKAFLDLSDDTQVEANFRLQDVLVRMYLNRIRGQGSQHDGETLRFHQLGEALKQDLSRAWTVEEMATLTRLSVNHFRLRFKRMFGMTPKHWLEEQRISRAAELISAQDGNIKSIGCRVGYRDPYHFSRVFKRVMSVSPRQYRTQILQAIHGNVQ